MGNLATIDLEAPGQAFGWALDGSRTIFTIDRARKVVRRIEMPAIGAVDAAAALTFR